LQVARIVVDVRARRRGDLAGIDAVPDGEAQLVLGDERGGGFLVVDGQRDDLDAEFGKRVERAGERGELRVAVRAPGPAVDQDDAVSAGEVVRQRDRAAANSGDLKRGERLTVAQSGHRYPSRNEWTTWSTMPRRNWTHKSNLFTLHT
jgi:hypothetical protein